MNQTSPRDVTIISSCFLSKNRIKSECSMRGWISYKLSCMHSSHSKRWTRRKAQSNNLTLASVINQMNGILHIGAENYFHFLNPLSLCLLFSSPLKKLSPRWNSQTFQEKRVKSFHGNLSDFSLISFFLFSWNFLSDKFFELKFFI